MAIDVSQIPFKSGLTAAQKQSIINLVQGSPYSQWSQTDKNNWAYATNNAWVTGYDSSGTATQVPRGIYVQGMSPNPPQQVQQTQQTQQPIVQQPTVDLMANNVMLGDKDDQYLFKFTEDIDGSGPADQSTVWLVDQKTKTFVPFTSYQAFTNYYLNDPATIEAAKKSIKTTSISSVLGQNNEIIAGQFAGFKILGNSYGVQSDGNLPAATLNYNQDSATATSTSIAARYGQPQDQTKAMDAWSFLNGSALSGGGLLNLFAQNGISQSTIDTVAKDPVAIATYVNAIAYGGYTADDIFRDIKRKELVASGRSDLAGTVVIDPSKTKADYLKTAAGSAIPNLTDIAPPKTIAGVDSSVLSLPAYKMPDDFYKQVVKTADVYSPEFKAEAEKIAQPYYDIMTRMAEATTESERQAAFYDYQEYKKYLDTTYGIKLSDNAFSAWDQIQQLGQGYSDKGLSDTGIAKEGMDKYLASVRRSDAVLREQKITNEDAEKRKYYLNYASPEEINALDAATKEKWGLAPDSETKNWFSFSNLKNLYPNLTDNEINNYISSIIDPYGNYYSSKQQLLKSNTLKLSQEKSATQQTVLLQKKLDEEAANKAKYTQSTSYFDYTPGGSSEATSSSNPTNKTGNISANPQNTDYNQILNQQPQQTSQTKAPQQSSPQSTNNIGTSSPTKTATHTVLAYDSNNNYAPIYVQPGVYTPGASLTKPANTTSTTSTTSSATQQAASNLASTGSSSGTKSTYTGSSIVDYLKSAGQDTSYSYRSNLAKQNNISNYTGTAAQNTALLKALRGY